MEQILTSSGLALLLCLITTPILIPFLRKLKFGQSIREEGPSWHQSKSGTPTMGGLTIILASAVAVVAAVHLSGGARIEAYLLIGTAVLFGVIGFADDFIKVILKRNLGLSAKQKFLAQLFVSILSTIAFYYLGIINGEVVIPFFSRLIDIGLWILPLAVLVQLAVVNSVNLTDGLDGLASSVTLVVGIFLTIVAYLRGETTVAAFMGAVSGSCLGFLFFNRHPAKVFMGDTGSLFLGGAVAAAAIALKMPLILIITGGVYLIETLSVILQVVSFKLTGKRIFKMSPIHHHFEMCGFKETQIVLLFSAAAIAFCILSYFAVAPIL